MCAGAFAFCAISLVTLIASALCLQWVPPSDLRSHTDFRQNKSPIQWRVLPILMDGFTHGRKPFSWIYMFDESHTSTWYRLVDCSYMYAASIVLYWCVYLSFAQNLAITTKNITYWNTASQNAFSHRQRSIRWNWRARTFRTRTRTVDLDLGRRIGFVLVAKQRNSYLYFTDSSLTDFYQSSIGPLTLLILSIY